MLCFVELVLCLCPLLCLLEVVAVASVLCSCPLPCLLEVVAIASVLCFVDEPCSALLVCLVEDEASSSSWLCMPVVVDAEACSDLELDLLFDRCSVVVE